MKHEENKKPGTSLQKQSYFHKLPKINVDDVQIS